MPDGSIWVCPSRYRRLSTASVARLLATYLDTGNRSFFGNNAGLVDLHPVLGDRTPCVTRDADSCAPFIYAASTVQPIWQRLADRATQLGYKSKPVEVTQDPMP